MAMSYSAGGCSMAAPAPRLPRTLFWHRSSSLRHLPTRLCKRQVSGSKRSSSFLIKASSEDTSDSLDVVEVFSDLKEKWDALENKSTFVIYGSGAIVAVWLSSAIVGAINSVPVVPKIMELVGVGYSGWFVYRYLLFKSSRKELASDIEDLKKKITGSE